MENKRSKGKIYPIKWSPISPNTNFASFFFQSNNNVLEIKHSNPMTIQVSLITLTPVVDKDGNLFNQVSPVVFFLN